MTSEKQKPRRGFFYARTVVSDPKLTQEDWYHWQNEIMLPQFLDAVLYKNSRGAEGPTMLVRYENANPDAPSEYKDMCLILAPDLDWFDNDKWIYMPCWHEPIAPGVGSVQEAITSYQRTYEMVDFYDYAPGERGTRMIVLEETPADGGDEEYHAFYQGQHLKDIATLKGLQFMCRAKYVQPTTPANFVLENEADIPKYIVMYFWEDHRYDKAAWQATRNTEQAKKVISGFRQFATQDWNMALMAESSDANVQRQAAFRESITTRNT